MTTSEAIERDTWNKAINAVRDYIQSENKTANWIEERHGQAAADNDYRRAAEMGAIIPVLERARDANLT